MLQVTHLLPCNENANQETEKRENNTEPKDKMAILKLIKQQLLPIFRPPLLWRTFMTSFLQFGTFAA